MAQMRRYAHEQFGTRFDKYSAQTRFDKNSAQNRFDLLTSGT